MSLSRFLSHLSSRRWLSAPLVALLLLTLAVPAFARDEVELAWKFERGQTLRWMTTVHEVANMGAGREVTDIEIEERWDVQRLDDDGVARIRISYEAIRVEFEGNGEERTWDSSMDDDELADDPRFKLHSVLVGVRLTAEITPQGEVESLSGHQSIERDLLGWLRDSPDLDRMYVFVQGVAQYSEEALASRIEMRTRIVPDEPVRRRARYESEWFLPQLGIARVNIEGRLRYQGTDEVEIDGEEVEAHEIEIEGNFSVTREDDIPEENPFREAELSLSRGSELEGTAWFDAERGVLLRLATEARLALTLSGGEMDEPLRQQVEAEEVTELVD